MPDSTKAELLARLRVALTIDKMTKKEVAAIVARMTALRWRPEFQVIYLDALARCVMLAVDELRS